MKRYIVLAALCAIFSSGAARAACTVPNMLTNGTTADATQVMANFTSITSCAAPTVSPTFTGTATFSGTIAGPLNLSTVGVSQLVLNKTGSPHGNNIVFQQSGANEWVIGQQSGDNSGNFNYFSYVSNGIVLSISKSTNNVTCGGSCISASDERVKTNIVALGAENGLSAIRRLKPVTFNWRKGDTDSRQIGFIAQRVREVLPALVTNSEIVSLETPGGMLALNYGAMAAPIVLSVQELDSEVSALKRHMSEIIREVAYLKDRNRQTLAEITSLRTQLNESQSESMERLNARIERLERGARVHTASK